MGPSQCLLLPPTITSAPSTRTHGHVMILDKKEEKREEAMAERPAEGSSTQQQQQPPSYSPTTELTSSPSLPSSSSASSYPRDIKASLSATAPSTHPPLPYIFPPLYSPSPTSPFLLAYPPALAAQGVPEAIFLARPIAQLEPQEEPLGIRGQDGGEPDWGCAGFELGIWRHKGHDRRDRLGRRER